MHCTAMQSNDLIYYRELLKKVKLKMIDKKYWQLGLPSVDAIDKTRDQL